MAAPWLPFKSLPCSYLRKSEFNVCIILRSPFQMETCVGWGDWGKRWRPAGKRAREGSGMLQRSLGHSRGQRQAEKQHCQLTKSCCWPSGPVPRCHLPVGVPGTSSAAGVRMSRTLAHAPHVTRSSVPIPHPKPPSTPSVGVTDPAKPHLAPAWGFVAQGVPAAGGPHGTRQEGLPRAPTLRSPSHPSWVGAIARSPAREAFPQAAPALRAAPRAGPGAS